MALFNEVKAVLRVSTTDAGINAEIQSYIDSAIFDLTKTADIADFGENPDALVKTAIFTYVRAMWTRDTAEADKLMAAYEMNKKTLLMSSAYGTFKEADDGLNEGC